MGIRWHRRAGICVGDTDAIRGGEEERNDGEDRGMMRLGRNASNQHSSGRRVRSRASLLVPCAAANELVDDANGMHLLHKTTPNSCTLIGSVVFLVKPLPPGPFIHCTTHVLQFQDA